MNQRTDAALIKITNSGDDLPYVPMGDSASLVHNQPALGLSYPAGQKAGAEPVVRFGRVVRSRRSRGMLQSSVLMEPGDSGGPLFDLHGCVIGIHSRIGRSMDRNYEVPIDSYRAHWNELNREGFFTRSGPQRPSLGLRVQPPTNSGQKGRTNEKNDSNSPDEKRSVEQRDARENAAGLIVVDVRENGLAYEAGIRRGDRISRVDEWPLQTFSDLRDALKVARKNDVESVKIQLVRKNETEPRTLTVAVLEHAAPEVPLPKGDHPVVPTPQGFSELSRFAQQFSDLESKLDDACVKVISDAGDGVSLSITGTRIEGTRWIVSKSSVVGREPKIQQDSKGGDKLIALEIVERDFSNDLVLLRAPKKNTRGIDLQISKESVLVGTFLLTPDEDGPGLVSVVGIQSFTSRKHRSRGFLDVVPETYKRNQGAYIESVNKGGAANRAGLMVGDVITQMNDILIRTQLDLRRFLSQVDPNTQITATVRRDEDELTKSITLGAFPSRSNHAANQMDKSGRRDGFRRVFSHDADLKPDQCGGPLFDLDGNFVGLNVARNSRVRSFALTANMLKEFIDRAAGQAAR